MGERVFWSCLFIYLFEWENIQRMKWWELHHSRSWDGPRLHQSTCSVLLLQTGYMLSLHAWTRRPQTTERIYRKNKRALKKIRQALKRKGEVDYKRKNQKWAKGKWCKLTGSMTRTRNFHYTRLTTVKEIGFCCCG